MRRISAMWFVTVALACGCAAGLAAPAALAAGSGGVTITNPAGSTPAGTTPQPSFNLNNAGNSAANNALTPSPNVVAPASSSSSSGGLSSLAGFVIAGVAIALLVGIALLVRNDAHRHLASIRHGERDDAMFATAHSGSKAQRKTRKLTPAERKRRKRGRAR